MTYQLTIKRPEGDIEIKDVAHMNNILFGKMKEATMNAGRGELLSWEEILTKDEINKMAAVKKVEAKYKAAGYCAKCESFCYGSC